MMYLSDAIRIGCAFKPQAFGGFNVGGGTCALGAAGDAVGGMRAHGVATYYELFVKNFKEYSRLACQVPIVHFNDDLKMSREAIADLVEAKEVELGIRPMIEGDTIVVEPNFATEERNKELALALV